MDYEEFVAGYPRDPDPAPRLDAARERLLEQPREFARVFGIVLHDYLSGGSDEPTPKQLADFVQRYLGWARANLGALIRAVETRGNRFDRHQPIMEMSFHHVMQIVHPVLPALLFGRPILTSLHLRDMQIMVALGGTAMGGVRERRARQSKYFADYNAPLRSVQSGILTELDTAIVLLELCRQLPHLAVLPAPPQFERGSTGRNVDFLVLDPIRRKVVGVQVKTTVSRKTVNRYDPRGIVLVDGTVDLGNVRSVALRANSSDTTPMPWPGLISAHYVASLRPGSPAVVRFSPELITRSRRTARTVTAHSRSYFEAAVRHVAPRVLAKLYEQG